ncbi:MAG: hypothetical protein AAF290_04895 [Pseudomonadota bacterium]
MNKLQSFSKYLNNIAARNEPLKWRGQRITSVAGDVAMTSDETTAKNEHWIGKAQREQRNSDPR